MATRATHDVVVIGSGASGGMAAYNLTQLGVKVLMLDAGGKFDRTNLWTHVLPFEADARLRAGEAPPPYFLDSKNEQPYLTPEDKPFNLIRVWGLGGKTNVWGRVSLRMSDLDFRSAELDGWGIPWPIRYADLAPYYDRVDQLIGVCGGDDDSDVLPGSRYHMPPPPPRCHTIGESWTGLARSWLRHRWQSCPMGSELWNPECGRPRFPGYPGRRL